jgi:hypothetical protein
MRIALPVHVVTDCRKMHRKHGKWSLSPSFSFISFTFLSFSGFICSSLSSCPYSSSFPIIITIMITVLLGGKVQLHAEKAVIICKKYLAKHQSLRDAGGLAFCDV